MERVSGAVERFDRAALLLPHNLRDRARELKREERASCEEFRLRLGYPASVVMPEGERSMGGDPVTKRELGFVLEAATGASVHSASSRLAEGFITAKGGFRVGLCGAVGLSGGEPGGFTSVSSAAIRISREHKGACVPIIDSVYSGGEVRSTLIISPPGGGKTTLLRDLVRYISDAAGGPRVGLCDERSEIAAFFDGEPTMDVGRRTDVLDGCPKARAVSMLLRSMNPGVIAIDEITAEEDAEAMTRAAHCGVKLIATAHAASRTELAERPIYRALLASGVFEELIIIRKLGGRRSYLREAML
ncbi:MAG: stage III sporulation protein AB [Oscillospiraceae bacterium]|nr:stage III sporulation protein AB [Oscillospiraceae bacterium]MBQ2230204.1 stage III sporulation protein AB [Oscillospiraceae bacterium]